MTFVDDLRSGRTLLMDGGMGTELMRRGHVGPTWRANLDAPDLVRAIHADYVAAGAKVLLTNTFLTPPEMEPIRAAVRLARSHGAHVLGAFGPEFLDAPTLLDAVAALGDIDGLLLETCSDSTAFDAVRRIHARHPNLPILVSFTFQANGRTFANRTPEEIARAAENIVAVGANCGVDLSPRDFAGILRHYRSATSLPLFARPNAGSPTRVGANWTHPLDANTWAEQTAELSDAAMLGGCCGTTPEHVRELARRLER